LLDLFSRDTVKPSKFHRAVQGLFFGQCIAPVLTGDRIDPAGGGRPETKLLTADTKRYIKSDFPRGNILYGTREILRLVWVIAARPAR